MARLAVGIGGLALTGVVVSVAGASAGGAEEAGGGGSSANVLVGGACWRTAEGAGGSVTGVMGGLAAVSGRAVASCVSSSSGCCTEPGSEGSECAWN